MMYQLSGLFQVDVFLKIMLVTVINGKQRTEFSVSHYDSKLSSIKAKFWLKLLELLIIKKQSKPSLC